MIYIVSKKMLFYYQNSKSNYSQGWHHSEQTKPAPEVPASHTDTGSGPGCGTSDLAPCSWAGKVAEASAQPGVPALGGSPEEETEYWLQIGTTLATAAI